MKKILHTVAALLLALTAAVPVCAEDVLLRLDNVPENGLVVAEVDLTAAAQWTGVASVTPAGLRAAADSGATVQFVNQFPMSRSEAMELGRRAAVATAEYERRFL